MCKATFFRTPCSRQDLLTAIRCIDSNLIDTTEWAIISTSQSLPAYRIFPVEPSFELCAGDYLYIIFDDEKDAIELAAKVKCGTMVLPESSEPVYYFIMRVD